MSSCINYFHSLCPVRIQYTHLFVYSRADTTKFPQNIHRIRKSEDLDSGINWDTIHPYVIPRESKISWIHNQSEAFCLQNLMHNIELFRWIVILLRKILLKRGFHFSFAWRWIDGPQICGWCFIVNVNVSLLLFANFRYY